MSAKAQMPLKRASKAKVTWAIVCLRSSRSERKQMAISTATAGASATV